MKRKQLLAVCEHLIQSFHPDKTTLDAHADEELRHIESPTDRLFLQQVFYGSFRYRELLKSLLTHFLDAHASRVSRTDYTKFLIVAYLAVFRLAELGMPSFAALVAALEPTSMHALLSFLFDREILCGPVKRAWVTVLDEAFVESELITKMLAFEAEVAGLLQQLHIRAFGQAGVSSTANLAQGASDGEKTKKKKPPTVPVAPNITQPRLRQAAEPIRIPQEVKATPVPLSLNQLTLADLEQQQVERKKATQARVAKKYADAAKTMFQFESTARSNLERVRQEVEAARAAELQFDFKATPAPAAVDTGTRRRTTSREPHVKLNAATILREDALVKKQQAKDAQLLRAYETELRDPLAFFQWQADMLAQDERQWKADVEHRRLEMVQAQYDAVEAAHQARLDNREVALEMKGVAKDLEAFRLAEDAALEERYRVQNAELKRVRETAPRDAETKVKDGNARQREELNAFLTTERARKAAQDALEQTQREELIRQIRALDRVRREHVASFDPTATAQLGLLDEMSLAELQERLRERKTQQVAWEEARRDDIGSDKQAKDAQLLATAQTLARLRSAAASANASTKSKKQAREAAKLQQEAEARREGNRRLAEKLTAQRQAREQQTVRLQQESDAIAKKRLFLGAAKNVLEENHFEQLQRGCEREAIERQCTFQTDATTMEAVRAQEKAMRKAFSQAQALAKRSADDAKAQLVERARRDGRAKDRDEDETNRSLVRHEQKRFLHAKEILQSRNVYAASQSVAGTTQARAAATTRASTSARATRNGSRNQVDDR